MKKTIPFTFASKRINLPQEVKDLYSENCKALRKEIEGYTNKWRDIWCSWIRRINIIEMFYYPKQSTDSMQTT